MTYACHLCGLSLASRKSLASHLHRATCTTPKRPRAVCAGELVARLEGLPSIEAGRICGVDGSTVRRWRSKGVVSPDVLAQVLSVLDGRDAPIEKRKPGSQSVYVDVHCTWTPDGWIVDAYKAGTVDPLNSIAMAAAAGQRWPTLDEAQAFARRRFGYLLVRLTPAATEQRVAS